MIQVIGGKSENSWNIFILFFGACCFGAFQVIPMMINMLDLFLYKTERKKKLMKPFFLLSDTFMFNDSIVEVS